MSAVRKYTMNLPSELVEGLVKQTGKTATATVVEALQELRRRRAAELFISLRGTVDFGASYEELVGKNDPDPWDKYG